MFQFVLTKWRVVPWLPRGTCVDIPPLAKHAVKAVVHLITITMT